MIRGLIGKYGFGAAVPTVLVAMGLLVAAGSSAEAQSAHRTRRESNANRKARIARIIQDSYTRRWEAGGGGGYLRFRTGPSTRQVNEVTYWGSALYNLTPRLGIVGLTGGAFGSARIQNGFPNAANPQIQEYNFMAGPSYRIVARAKYAVSLYGAGGVGWGRFSTGPKDFPPQTVGLWPSGFNAAFGAGVNLDYNFFPNLAFRVTPTYLGTTFGGTLQNSKGVNVGLVYRFGRIR